MSIEGPNFWAMEQLIGDGDIVSWGKFNEAVRAARWELIWGPMERGYWENVEPLEHYKWTGWSEAIEYIEETVNSLPTLWWDTDFEEFTYGDPWENEDNWVKEDDPDYPDDEKRYIGPQDYYEVSPRDLLPHILKEYV